MATTEREAHDFKWRDVNQYIRYHGYVVNWMYDYMTNMARYRLTRLRPFEVLLQTNDEQELINLLNLLIGQMEVER